MKEPLVKPVECCADWRDNIEILNAPIVNQTIRSGGRWKYDGKPFTHCPWCGSRLSQGKSEVTGEKR